MIYQLPPEALRTDASAGSRWLTIALLDGVGASVARLADPCDIEALHDFRVSVRRLRACLRACAPVLGDGVEPFARVFRDIGASTSSARDAEVQLEWIAARRDSFSRQAADGVATITGSLIDIKVSGYRETGLRLETELPEIEAAFRSYLRRLDTLHEEGFVEYLGRCVTQHINDLENKMRGLGWIFDEARGHRARISAKRLRYLVEPLVTTIPFTRSVVSRLEELQEVLGTLHDRQALGHMLRDEIGRMQSDRERWFAELSSGVGGPAHESPPELAGLMELARVSRGEQEQLYREFQRQWPEEDHNGFFGAAREMAERLPLIIPELI